MSHPASGCCCSNFYLPISLANNSVSIHSRGDSLMTVGTDVRAQALGFSGLNFCLGIRFWEVSFAQALGFMQLLAKNV